MTETEFIPTTTLSYPEKGAFTWEAPSNIALVKYWGKYGEQLPKNPSVSFTLSNCKTTTTLKFQKKEESKEKFDFQVFLDQKRAKDFDPKIALFFERVLPYLPFLKEYQFTIETHNSFPHSSGIASSASGMSALALCLLSIEKAANPKLTEDYFTKKAAFLARLGSGSATRSLQGEVVIWGEHKTIENSSNLYGIKVESPIHENFKNYKDTVLLVDKGQKTVSSTLGHNLMIEHPYAEQRFEQAFSNTKKLLEILKSGDLDKFIHLVESEALALHAMMMTSSPYFILMQPNTLAIIHKIWQFRKENNSKICFTLDAGANVHLLYPAVEEAKVLDFIKNQLVAHCQKEQYICDQVGKGAKQLHFA
ncbi:diphosphomevalonate/mevalonate 3,5-bisphosphate decarboxylase family protein [Haloflavibacter putidus]|uniref:Diphosphomevalonate decarboxylase n=1 Tax=Haloflavibacter putidus TaxID=2576776 RepID=A0A507ZT21_9FLAO|nr:diphosphomevalonate decarboxylase [Haloflavibacter putidus]TQD38868.1 diphosphomevalonate decarboxylase [Haloflavibacter putidus]